MDKQSLCRFSSNISNSIFSNWIIENKNKNFGEKSNISKLKLLSTDGVSATFPFRNYVPVTKPLQSSTAFSALRNHQNDH